MRRSDPLTRIERAYRGCELRSAAKQRLLDRYYTGVHMDRGGAVPESEVLNFYEVCRILEQGDLAELSIECLERLIDIPGLSPTAVIRRRCVIGRLVKLLEQDGLPSRAERRANQRVHEAVNQLPLALRRRVSNWIGMRSKMVCWHELVYEAERIAALEQHAAGTEKWQPEEIVTAWIARIVRPVVNCGCPPVTRDRDGHHCTSCGKTIETSGGRPAPGDRKQKELKSLGLRYLAWRTAEESAS